MNKDGVIDWDAATRGWQAKAAQKAGVDLASLYRRVSRLGRNGCAPRDAGPQLTRDEITRAAQKALEKCSRENSKWTRADLIANLGRVLPRRAADPDGQAALAGGGGRPGAGGGVRPGGLPGGTGGGPGAGLAAPGRWAERVPAARRGQVRDQGAAVPGGEARVPRPVPGTAPAMSREEAARALGAERRRAGGRASRATRCRGQDDGFGLRMDQAAAAFHVLTSDRRVEVIVGPAGAGKTRVLAEIGRAWSQGRVVGITPSQSSRDVLAAAGVAESYNFAQFLGHLKERRGALGPVKLSRGRPDRHGRGVDVEQPGLRATSSTTRPGSVSRWPWPSTTSSSRRWRTGEEPAWSPAPRATCSFPSRCGSASSGSARRRWACARARSAALADYAEHGRIRAGTAEEILEAAAQAYVAHTLEGKDSLLIARSHELRRELCRRVRGRPAAPRAWWPGTARRSRSPTGSGPAVGDLIVCTDNDHSVDAGEGKTLANMHVLRIEAITAKGPVVRRMLEPDPQTAGAALDRAGVPVPRLPDRRAGIRGDRARRPGQDRGSDPHHRHAGG